MVWLKICGDCGEEFEKPSKSRQKYCYDCFVKRQKTGITKRKK